MIAARRLLRDRSRSVRWWALGISALIVSTTSLYPTIEGNQSFENLAAELPEAVSSLFGIEATVAITSAPGYLHARLFSTLLPVVVIILGIGLGTRALAGSEEDGTLELTLAQPITRLRLAAERYAAVAALVAVITGLAAVILFVSAAAAGALSGVSNSGLFVACAAVGCLALLHASIAFAVGAATGRRSAALGASTTVAVAGFLLHGLIEMTSSLDRLRFATPWDWYLDRNMLVTGPDWSAVALPLVVSGALVLAGVKVFERRDLR